MTYLYIEDFVQELYQQIGIYTPEQLDYVGIAQHLSIAVYTWPQGSMALFHGKQSYIMLRASASPIQQWQDFCHELCHVLLHTGHQGNMAPLFREYQENKANNFMYHACMPTFMLDALHVRDYMPITIRRLQQLFGVEYDFALKRITQYLMNQMLLNWNGRHTDAVKE